MTTVVFHRLATADFIRARRRYSRYAATTAARFEQAVSDARNAIASNPTAGTSSSPPFYG